jgi:hypothetical protein
MRHAIGTSVAAAAFAGFAGFAQHVSAADIQALAGTWMMVSNVVTAPSGEKSHPFGPNPQGTMMLAPDGRYIITVMKPGLPKFAANSRDKATVDEMKAIVGGSISHVGRAKVEGDAIVFNIDRSTYPNWDGTTQKRTFTLTGDELVYRVPAASISGTAEVVWKRAK